MPTDLIAVVVGWIKSSTTQHQPIKLLGFLTSTQPTASVRAGGLSLYSRTLKGDGNFNSILSIPALSLTGSVAVDSKEKQEIEPMVAAANQR